MSKEKYYTPTVDEFHVGFEFEFLNTSGKLADHPSNKKEWEAAVCDEDWLKQILEEYENDPESVSELFRVKHLDRKDIESLGWTDFQHSICDWYKWKKFVECPMAHYYHHALRLQHDYDKNGLTIRAYEFEHLMEKDKDPVNLYRGIVKNKSELVRIMNRANII